MNIKKYLDLGKYLTSYLVATAASLITKSFSSWILSFLGYGNLVIAIGSSLLCTAVFFGTKWPLYRRLHEVRYARSVFSVSRDRKVELVTTIISSLVTNAVSVATHYILLGYFKEHPGSTGFVSQFAGGGAGAVIKIFLDTIFGLVFPSDKKLSNKTQ